MERFKNTMQIGAEKIMVAKEIDTIQKDRLEVFNFIYTMSSQKEIYNS